MDKVIILRYAEIHLKGRNRAFFENLLKKNLANKLKGISCKIVFNNCRYIISDFDMEFATEIERKIKQVFGVSSCSVAIRTSSCMDDIFDAAKLVCKKSGKFRVTVNRAEKRMNLTSTQIAAEIGRRFLDEFSTLSVDLHSPDFVVFVDVRDFDTVFVYGDSAACAGGLPVGASGNGLIMLSGGIDSPVAAYAMAKRGMKLTALHFWSYPYTNMMARQKVIDLTKIISGYNGQTKLLIASLTEIQEAIHKYCDPNFMITLVRRAMMRVAERVAIKYGLQCIINGESLGQVASQTVESITATNLVVRSLPVFRPLIGMDKTEIIGIAQKIDTYATSIQPYEDCCTAFLPDNPVTKPSMKKVEYNEKLIPNYEELICKIVDELEIISD